MAAQNYTYLIFDTVPKEVQLPFFVSTVDPSTPLNCRVEIQFKITDVSELPDAEVYERTSRGPELDKWDAMLNLGSPSKSLRFPKDVWFPVSISDERREAAGAYSVVQWLDDQTAIVDLVSSDKSVTVDAGTKLTRRCRSEDGVIVEKDIGSVSKVIDYALTK